MENNATKSIDVTKNALKRILDVIKKDSSSLNFRVFVTGGGCSGFQYGFKFDDDVAFDDDVENANNMRDLILLKNLKGLTFTNKIKNKE